MKLTHDSTGNHFITDCDIYHFYGEKARDFFSAWVLKDTQQVVKIPIVKNQYMNQDIEDLITAMKEKGYKHEIV